MYQSTPLHIASAQDHDEVVKILLQHEAKLDAKDSEGKVKPHPSNTNYRGYLLIIHYMYRCHLKLPKPILYANY